MSCDKITFRNIVDCIFDNKFKDLSTTEILKNFHEESDILLKQWVDSKETDFSIYQDEKYLKDLMICYYYVSRQSIVGSLKWFEKNNIDISKMRCFEDHNGLGATTLHLLNKFESVDVFNYVLLQREIFKKLYYHFCQVDKKLNQFYQFDERSDELYTRDIIT
jgi:hypothetical protein